jgi:hypothetical protein
MKREQDAYRVGVRRIICDRSLLDASVYVFSSGDKAGADKLFDRVRFWIPTYTKLWLLDPTDVPYKQDAIRQESEEVRQGFHQAFLDFFRQKGVRYELLSGTVDERMKRVDQSLGLV